MTERRRVVAIVLPNLLTELASAPLATPKLEATDAARARRRAAVPLGVLLVDESTASSNGEKPPPDATSVLAAVNEGAERYGVRVGQTITEAHALVARLLIREVTRAEVCTRLGEVAEVALGFGPTVALESPDTVWVDITGSAHLAGGEDALALELGARVRALGHVVRVTVSDGPRLAQAFGRWGRMNREGSLVVGEADTAHKMAELPVRAVAFDAELTAWLVRLGIHTVGDLARLPRAATASRLGGDSARLLDLAEGRDESPLVAYVPPAIPREETSWDDAVSGVEPLLFVLRGLVSRLGARLEGRGEAVQVLELVVLHDSAVARFEQVPRQTALRFELSTPLWRPEELFRVVASRLGRTELPASSVGLRLEAHAITRALALQLNLSRYGSGLGGSAGKGPETLPVLLAELSADLGKDKVGILKLEGSHRPERKSRLSSASEAILPSFRRDKMRREAGSSETPSASLRESAERREAPTRLLPRPIAFDAPLRTGVTVSVEHRLFSVERVRFEKRLDAVEWWTPEPVSRDYARVWLSGASGGLEAIVYVDRNTGARMIQAFAD
ncbi:MAG TPA: DNA polymerase Y family protein [Polyangiaceae bacterium]|jgi:protein ImuB|nr:DNA polymerase Y family protein [Polyangiaceae bacterium]